MLASRRALLRALSPRIVERGHIFLDMPCGHVIEIMDALFMQPGHVFMQVGTVRADRGLGQSPFHVNVREELPDQTSQPSMSFLSVFALLSI